MKHTCRKGGKPIGALEGPAWAVPGEIVKLADEENWGRVTVLYHCCHTYEVQVEAFGEQEAGTLVLGPDGLENAWGNYPANMPPKGYPVPKPNRQAGVQGDPVKTINSIERLKHSRNGNPRFRISFTDGSVAVTQSDSSFGYAVGNTDMREGCRVTVEYTRAGRISHMEPVGP